MDERLSRAITPIHERILAHPFLSGLGDGSLPEASFRHYVVQDALFLADYARALALCAARARETADLRLFCAHATEAIDVERALHDELMSELGIDGDELARAEQSPACRGYTSFLLASCALGDVAEGMGAILPCYWIYWQVGRVLVERGSPDPRYRRWIETYADEEFGRAVTAVVEIADRTLSGLPEAAVASATRCARTASRYEWLFWDSALRREGWPV